MYYRPFDRSMGLWIINEFLNYILYLFLVQTIEETLVWAKKHKSYFKKWFPIFWI